MTGAGDRDPVIRCGINQEVLRSRIRIARLEAIKEGDQ